MASNCKKCGSPMGVRENKNGGYYAACTTPEKHPGYIAPAAADPVVATTVAPPVVEQPKKKRAIDLW